VSEKIQPSRREAYQKFSSVETRWNDNDSYGHVNNVVYYEFFDTAVNRHLIEQGVLNLASSEAIGLVIETKCTYFSSITFPDTVHVGLKVLHLGNSSVRYQIGLFKNSDNISAAMGEFVHVYVNRQTNQPVSIPQDVRAVLQALMVPPVQNSL
jgi:acyl-CoA thioester hydrolase